MKKRPQVVATIALCAVVVALAIGVIAQQLSASRMAGDIDVQKQLIAKYRQDLKERAKYSGEYGDLSLKLGGRMSTCTWSDQMPYMVAQVTGIVESNGVKVASLQPEPLTSSGSIQRFPMRITLETDLKHLTDVLHDFKDAQPLIDIERLDIRNSQSGSGKLQINMTVASFVVLDKNSPVVRRRAVIPKKTEPAPMEAKTPAATPEVRQPGKPAAKAPEAKPAAGPRSNGMEPGRVGMPQPPHTTVPTNANGTPAMIDIKVGDKTMKVPAGTNPDVIKRIQERANGGAK